SLAEAVTRLFNDSADAALRAEREGWQGALWNQVVELGLTHTLVPEDLGGFGGQWSDAYTGLQTSGYYSNPFAIGAAMLASKLLAAAGLEVPSGSLSLCFVHTGELVRTADAFSFRGTLSAVPWGRDVEHIVAIATLENTPHAIVLRRRNAVSLNPAQT